MTPTHPLKGVGIVPAVPVDTPFSVCHLAPYVRHDLAAKQLLWRHDTPSPSAEMFVEPKRPLWLSTRTWSCMPKARHGLRFTRISVKLLCVASSTLFGLHEGGRLLGLFFSGSFTHARAPLAEKRMRVTPCVMGATCVGGHDWWCLFPIAGIFRPGLRRMGDGVFCADPSAGLSGW